MATADPHSATPLPSGAVHADDWSDAGNADAFRIFTGPVWDIEDVGTYAVFVQGTQLPDGTVEGRVVRTNVPPPRRAQRGAGQRGRRRAHRCGQVHH